MSDLVPVKRVLESRFGVVTGLPSTWSTSGDHLLYTPQSGYRIRLMWISLYSDPANSASCIATVKWGGASGNVYVTPFPAGYGGFQHASVREGAVDETLKLNLSASQTVYVVGLDVEEFQ